MAAKVAQESLVWYKRSMHSSTTTRLLPIDPHTPASDAIAEAAALIRAGRLVAFPTETVYGLGANALDPVAVAAIFRAKGRPANDPLIVHIAAAADLISIAADLPPIAQILADRFWPGALTLVVPRQPHVPANLAAGRPTVAVRMPAHPVALALIRAAGVPIAAPSANLFSRPSPTTAQHVLDDLSGRIDLVLDGGPTRIGLESTIVDLTLAAPRILRPGGIPLEALRSLLPDITFAPRYQALEDQTALAAPGSLLKHYSPRAELRLVAGPRLAALAHLRATTARLVATNHRVALLLADEDAATLADLQCPIARLGPAADTTRIAARLFAALREADATGVDIILAYVAAQYGLGQAIQDRLVRAAEGRVTTVTDGIL